MNESVEELKYHVTKSIQRTFFNINTGRRDVSCASCLLTRLTERQASAATHHFWTTRTVQQTLPEKSLPLNQYSIS